MGPFLRVVTQGTRVPEERLQEVARHYEATGGASPYNRYALLLAGKVQRGLREAGIQLPLFLGMKNWHPFLQEEIQKIKQQGLTCGLGVVLAPHRSEASFGKYLRGVEEAKQQAQAPELTYDYLPSWYRHPLFIEAQADRVREVLRDFSQRERGETHLTFCAHSIPIEMDRNSDYSGQVRESGALVAHALNFPAWSVAYQSRSGPPDQPWLEPDILQAVRQVKEKGWRRIIIIPVGFIFDHTEVLYDLDIEAGREAGRLGLHFKRASTVMDHPSFVELFVRLIQERIAAS
ncbi:MAG: ferrochelatase [Candidatus Omnitrophica bacterium]|nr:ferrochelatase [Candidatus Omnitrophota bacterium]